MIILVSTNHGSDSEDKMKVDSKVGSRSETDGRKREVEVFVESCCRSCDAVLKVLRDSFRDNNMGISIYNRNHDLQKFEERNIIITPATFVNGKLAFYGEFSSAELRKHLERVWNTDNQ